MTRKFIRDTYVPSDAVCIHNISVLVVFLMIVPEN